MNMQSNMKPKVGDTVLVPCLVEHKGISPGGYQVVDLKVIDVLEKEGRLATRFSCYNDCLISYDTEKE